jgi:hypothetical protein
MDASSRSPRPLSARVPCGGGEEASSLEVADLPVRRNTGAATPSRDVVEG